MVLEILEIPSVEDGASWIEHALAISYVSVNQSCNPWENAKVDLVV